MKLSLFFLSILATFFAFFFIAPKTAAAFCACTVNCDRACGTVSWFWCDGTGGSPYGSVPADNGKCPAVATHRACSVSCTYGTATGIELGSITSGVTTWNGDCSASCPSCTTPTYNAYTYASNTCSENNGTGTCYTSGSNCNSTSCPSRYTTANNCDSCHIANAPAQSACSCVKQTPPTSPTISRIGGLYTPVKSGTSLTPTATCSNCSGINYSPGTTLLCNISDDLTTQVFSAYAYKNWGCTYNPTYQQSATTSETVTISPWFPSITGSATVSPNNLYDDEPMNISVSSSNDTTSVSFNFAGNTGNVPANNWNGDRAENTTHTVVFTPIHHNSCPTDKIGPTKTASHTTLRRPDPAIRNIAVSKALTRKGEAITVTGEIQNSHLWDFNILLDWQGNAGAMESFHLGHSGGRYNYASSYFTSGASTEGSWNTFSMTFTPTRETNSINANIKIDYHRILKPTAYRASQFNTNVKYEVAYLPTVTGVTVAPENGALTATITGDKFRILSKATDNAYRGDVFFNTTSLNTVPAISRGNLISWTMNQIKVSYPPMTGDVKVCLDSPIADGCSNTDKQYAFQTDSDVTSANNSWWTFKTLPPPVCQITIIDPPLNFLYILKKQDTSDPFLVQATWSNFDLRSPINITTSLNPATNAIAFTGPTTFDTTGRQDGNSTIQMVAVTTLAQIGSYNLTINGTSPIAGGWSCASDSLGVRVDVDPFLKTTGGDVHSNQEISVPGGP